MMGAIRSVTPTRSTLIRSRRQAVAMMVHRARLGKSSGSMTRGRTGAIGNSPAACIAISCRRRRRRRRRRLRRSSSSRSSSSSRMSIATAAVRERSASLQHPKHRYTLQLDITRDLLQGYSKR